jgi:hypothetical protein
MPSDERQLREDLRALIRSRAVELGEKARKNRPVSLQEEIAELEGLRKLAGVLEQREPNLKRRRSLLAAAVLITAGLTSWLLFSRVESTTVLADLQLSEAGFKLTEDRVLFDRIGAAELTVSGFSTVDGPPPFDSSLGRSLAIEIRDGGLLSLAGPALRDGTRVRLGTGSRPGSLWIAFRGRATSLRITALGPVRLQGSQAAVFSSPQVIDLQTGGEEEVVVELKPRSEPVLDFAPHLRVRDLTLHRVREEGIARGTQATAESTVRGGSLVLEEVEASERRLRLGEPLTFRSAEGALLALSYKEGQWLLSFEGIVRGMETGFRGGYRSLMPTRGQWLQAHHSVWLFWGAAIYLMGLAYGVLKWLGIEV